MKKLFILLISLIFYTCSTSSDPNDNATKLYISPATSEISLSGENSLSLIIQDSQNSIFGISLQIGYNDSVLSFLDSTGFSSGDFFDQNAVSFVRNNGSTIHLSFSQLKGQNSKSGSGSICNLTFHASALGNSNIEINKNNLYFYDCMGDEITISNLNVESALIIVR
jgi:hypothetical protein